MPLESESDSELTAVLIAISRHYGGDPSFVLAGGGNTSAKEGNRLFVKASGHALATITGEGFVEMDRQALEDLLNTDLGTDRATREERFKNAIMAARVHPEKGQRPSVEVVLHHIMPQKYVVHTHSTIVNMVTCCTRGEELMRAILGDEILWIESVDPGFVLAQALRDGLREYRERTGKEVPRAVIMANHGLVVGGESQREVDEQTRWLLDKLTGELSRHPQGDPFGRMARLDSVQSRRAIDVIGPALRGLLATGEELKIATFDDSGAVLELVCGRDGQAVAAPGAVTPDQLVYCRSFPLWFKHDLGDSPEQTVEKLRQCIDAHQAATGFSPQIILVEGLGLFAVGDDAASAHTAKDVYMDAIKIMAGARRLGSVRYLDPDLRRFLEAWEVEVYRRGIASAKSKPGRAAGKVALVTGAAQGFGLEIARDLAAQGACVALADRNEEGAVREAMALGQQYGSRKTLALGMDVTSGESVENSLHQIVRRFGGLDLLVSNAGVLKAGSVKTQPQKEFEFVTSVNYVGYFVCVQKTAPIMAAQHLANPRAWFDIIQINSKSGLEGSNKNGAYAGGKFGGIGLTQSFALELVTDGIKVNAICPGNFFDGPLWSDPDNGLFAQYLRSGKVPGAQDVEDVKRFYESKVPMGRGCSAADVMKAIYYLMDQVYETGQALPVTGGQVMLR